jgi:CheY-like chemotaxis protein
MPPDVQSRIFEPFFSTKPAGDGGGLGLSMVFGFVKQSNGHISTYSELGRGTTIRLYLPRADEAGAPAPAESLPPAPGHGEVVLVVEDNANLRRVVVRQVRDLGYRAIEADGPRTALALLANERIDVLFSDVVMPGPMDGFELADEVARHWPETKVLLTSGFPGAAMTDRLAAYGRSVRLLGKPYRREELAQLLRLVLHD